MFVELELVMDGELGPLTNDQIPFPETGVLPVREAVVLLHKFWSVPALAVVGFGAIVICNWSELVLQGELAIDQSKMYVPAISPVTEVFGELALVRVGEFGPLTNVQVPFPATGVFPERVVVVLLHKFWSVPALAIVGIGAIII